MNGVEGSVRALHAELGTLWHKQNVGLVAAVLLVQEAPGFGEVHRFSAGNVPQKYHGVCDAASGLTISRSRSRVLWDSGSQISGSLLIVKLGMRGNGPTT